jgi:hypothetical protein
VPERSCRAHSCLVTDLSGLYTQGMMCHLWSCWGQRSREALFSVDIDSLRDKISIKEGLQMPLPSLQPEAAHRNKPPSEKRSFQQRESLPANLVSVVPTHPISKRRKTEMLPQLSAIDRLAGKDQKDPPGKFQKLCLQCGTKSTPVWRSGPQGIIFPPTSFRPSLIARMRT